ncbi:hypothetical protein [Streptomyces buecherae]|uniref:hypothetical protein n=1 Tax=Streptomyces buecherae TaxID=2763006 RepID=UPI0036962F2C
MFAPTRPDPTRPDPTRPSARRLAITKYDQAAADRIPSSAPRESTTIEAASLRQASTFSRRLAISATMSGISPVMVEASTPPPSSADIANRR